MNDILTGLGLKVQGHLKIFEYACRSDYQNNNPNRKLLDQRNAVHKDNASVLVINAITNRSNSNIRYMVFGTGGTTLDNTGSVTFKPTNINLQADLYSPVFYQMVDDPRGALPGNSMAVRHIANSSFTDIDIRALIDVNEPFGQSSSNTLDDITIPTVFGPLNSQFSFDEIGLKLADSTLITHVVFTPILKTASSLLEVVYTLRLAIAPVPQPIVPSIPRIIESVHAKDVVSTKNKVTDSIIETTAASTSLSIIKKTTPAIIESVTSSDLVSSTKRAAGKITEPLILSETFSLTNTNTVGNRVEATNARDLVSQHVRAVTTITEVANTSDLVSSDSISEKITTHDTTASSAKFKGIIIE